MQRMNKQTPVVVPLGSCEQHGHHLPLFVDSIQVTAIAERVEQRLKSEILLLPTLWLGSSHHHMDFPGTVSVLPSLYTQMIKSVARSILHAGFRRIFFLNGHGGNQVPGAQALTELTCEDDEANGAYLTFSSWWTIGGEAIAPDKHGLTTPCVSHACEYETSMLLFLRPDLVKLDAAREQAPAVDNRWFNTERLGNRVGVYHRYNRITAAGNLGKPSQGTAAKGEAMTAAVVDDIVAFLREFATWPELPAIGPK
jgi:creatinine amidohydrolase